MTIEEYLRKRIEEVRSDFLRTDESRPSWGYLWGIIDTLQEIVSKLPELDHEVTLRELHQFCDKHREEEGHHGCPFLIEGNPNAEEFKDRFPGCGLTRRYPCGWKPDVIQKLIKEVKE